MNPTQNVFLLGDIGNQSESGAYFTQACIEDGLIYVQYKQVKGVDAKTAEFPASKLLYAQISARTDKITSAVGRFIEPDALLTATTRGSTISYQIAADNEEAVLHWSKTVEGWTEPADIVEGKVAVSFWAMGANGPQQWERKIDVPKWDEIRGNYADDVQQQLDRIINRDFTATEGKLILLHGPPGSGKTYSIRAILEGWNKHATFSYVVDPERFLNAQPSYMLQLVLDGADDKYAYRYDEEEDESVKETHYHLLIMEDTGELLASDAKDRAGQGLSRLLNLVDGMIGQGINLIVLITTNEHINTFHPAVTRDGRCLAMLEIDKLSATEANRWLRERGNTEHIREEKSLAELYAIVNKSTKPVEEEVTHAGQYL